MSPTHEAKLLTRALLRDPRIGIDRLRRGIGVLRAMIVLRDCQRGPLVHAGGRMRIEADGDIEIGERVQFVAGMFTSELCCARGAKLTIGARSVFNYGISLRAVRSISIGDGCLVGSLVHIRDKAGERVAPVVVGNDVWIAHRACIEPGVTIGDGCIVSAGSVVTTDIPAGFMAIGNPATAFPIQAMAGTFQRPAA
jgi:acetyltransferase-like isoleucine patch superfamily enzyme